MDFVVWSLYTKSYPQMLELSPLIEACAVKHTASSSYWPWKYSHKHPIFYPPKLPALWYLNSQTLKTFKIEFYPTQHTQTAHPASSSPSTPPSSTTLTHSSPLTPPAIGPAYHQVLPPYPHTTTQDSPPRGLREHRPPFLSMGSVSAV